MKPESARARRRHSRWRMVQRALRLFRRWDATKIGMHREGLDERELSTKRRPNDPERLADNLKACSCYMCQNRREMDGPKRQERHEDDAA